MRLSRSLSTGLCCIAALLLAGVLFGCRKGESTAVDRGESAGTSEQAADSRGDIASDTTAPASGATAETFEGQPKENAGEETTASSDAAAETPEEPPTDSSADQTTATPDEQPSENTQAPAAEPVKIPLGLDPLPIPTDNPLTQEKIELGKLLYFDKRLSKDGTVACATCHDPTTAWTEHEPTSTGIGGQLGGRNSPTVINAAYARAQFWDGRSPSLEDQALGPIENPVEMGHKLDDLVVQLAKVPGYVERFQKAFGTGVTKEGIGKAIASFERTVLSGNSAYDRYKNGQEDALTDAQKRGLALFEDAGCDTCHGEPMFSNYRYYNAGVGADKEKPDEGRKAVTGKDRDLGKFRVPSLRDVAKTAPYFHDGSAKTLHEAVALMAGGGKDNPNLSPMIKSVRRAELSAEDQAAIVDFLGALSGEYPIVQPPPLP